MNARILAATLLAMVAVPRVGLGLEPAAVDVARSKGLVDAGKARGQVGEQADGYLGFVRESDDAPLKAAVAEINAGRAELYAEVAARYGIDPAVVGAASFQQRFDVIEPGQWYRNVDQVWMRK
jgi:uncharacterized protein